MSANVIASNTAAFLLSSYAAPMRAQRMATGMFACVVHVETHRGMIELDADDDIHAQVLVHAWIVNHGAKSARFHHVKEDGTLTKPSAIYDFLCYSETNTWND